LKQLMPRNSKGLTASALASSFGREPRLGRFRRFALREIDELEEEQRKAGERGLAEQAASLLRNLKGLFAARDKSKAAQQHKARRGT
jgi:hypothetical protein